MREKIGKLVGMVRRVGVRGVLRNVPVWCRIAYDRYHERRLGIDTEGIIGVDQLARLDGRQEHDAHAVFYQPWPYAKFRRLMRSAPGVDPETFTFVDFGSGKGRALVLAADHGFRRVVGVEMFASLCEEARSNIRRYREKAGNTAAGIEVVCMDATRYELPDGDLFCYFYNPFDEVVLRQVVAGIEAAIARSPRRVVIGYANPVCHGVFDAMPSLRLVAANDSFRTYASAA